MKETTTFESHHSFGHNPLYGKVRKKPLNEIPTNVTKNKGSSIRDQFPCSITNPGYGQTLSLIVTEDTLEAAQNFGYQSSSDGAVDEVNPLNVSSTGKEIGNKPGSSVTGVLAIKQPWPGMARSCLGDHARYLSVYMSAYKGYYFPGDGCRRDEDGYIWITGRVDDVLNVSGHRIGTAEVESALVAHPAVAQAAVVGGDELRMRAGSRPLLSGGRGVAGAVVGGGLQLDAAQTQPRVDTGAGQHRVCNVHMFQ